MAAEPSASSHHPEARGVGEAEGAGGRRRGSPVRCSPVSAAAFDLGAVASVPALRLISTGMTTVAPSPGPIGPSDPPVQATLRPGSSSSFPQARFVALRPIFTGGGETGGGQEPFGQGVGDRELAFGGRAADVVGLDQVGGPDFEVS